LQGGTRGQILDTRIGYWQEWKRVDGGEGSATARDELREALRSTMTLTDVVQ